MKGNASLCLGDESESAGSCQVLSTGIVGGKSAKLVGLVAEKGTRRGKKNLTGKGSHGGRLRRIDNRKWDLSRKN